MTEKYKYKQDDRIWFNMGSNDIKGYGKIVGCCSEPLEGLGRQWIIEIEKPSPIDNKNYPFSHMTIFDVMIKTPPVEVLYES